MSFNRVALFISCLLLALGVAITAQAQTKQYAVIGGGGEQAIGGGLPLPPQVFPTSVTGTIFPPLLVPVRTGPPPIVTQTTTMTTRQKLVVPPKVLSRPAAQGTVGLYAFNPTLYAVATNLGWGWPAATATISVSGRAGANVTTFTATTVGGTITYNAGVAGKFGGAGRFSITHGSGGRIANSPVTIYYVAKPGLGTPPCTHPAFLGGKGGNPACVAALIGAWPLTQGAIGGTTGVFGKTTPLGNPVPGIGIGKFGSNPLGTVSLFAFTPNSNPGYTNMASSQAYPWTAGKITISHPLAKGGAEAFTLTGMDSRTAGGAGTIQLVAGSLSTRASSGANANRGWVRLELREINRTPTMSPAGLAAMAALLVLAGAYAVRRKLSA